MSKLSPQFVKYFIFASIALAFIFPITHSAYEGFKEGRKNKKTLQKIANAANAAVKKRK
jgi:hypothetical protein